ncbi:MAG: DUF1036 domain-containing protein, partial [Methylocella sp.]
MPYSRAVINPKSKCPERSLPSPAGNPSPKPSRPAAWLPGSPSFGIRRREIAFPRQGSCFRETEGSDRAPFARYRRTGGPKPGTVTAAVLTSMKRAIIAAAMAISALAGSVAPVRADFRLCNNSVSRVSVSLAYTDGETWVSEGWW